MFNKDNNIKKIELVKPAFFKQYDNVYITPFYANMINKYYDDKNMQEHVDFDERTKSYIERIFTLNIKKQYDNTITNLYHNGKIQINNNEYSVKSFYVVFKKGSKDFHLMITDKNYQNEELSYDKAIKYIDTTAFIKLIKTSSIKDNTIIIEDINNLLDNIKNWDGLLHSETSETEAISNKDVAGDE